MTGRFLAFGPEEPHRCAPPSRSGPSAARRPRVGDHWQCGSCSAVHEWRRRVFRPAGWRVVEVPGYQLPIVTVSDRPPVPPPPIVRPDPTRVTAGPA